MKLRTVGRKYGGNVLGMIENFRNLFNGEKRFAQNGDCLQAGNGCFIIIAKLPPVLFGIGRCDLAFFFILSEGFFGQTALCGGLFDLHGRLLSVISHLRRASVLVQRCGFHVLSSRIRSKDILAPPDFLPVQKCIDHVRACGR